MKRIIGVMAVAVLLIAGLIAPATADDHEEEVGNTCKDLPPFSDTLDENSSGDWGSITFSDTEETLTLVVNAGWEVELCVKAGSAQQGNGPENAGVFGEGTYDDIGHSSGKELSHYDFIARELPEEPEEPTVTIVFTKIWAGEEFEGDAVATVNVSDGEDEVGSLADGDSLDVTDYQGETLWLEEDVDGLPTLCDYESDLPDSIEIEEVEEDTVIELEVTNDVDCDSAVGGVVIEDDEDDKEPEKKPVTKVLDETLEDDEDELPRTGVPALVLALLGLTAIGSGATILRRK